MAAQRFDPLQAFCFSIEFSLYGGVVVFCKSISGLKVEREVMPYREGGNNRFTNKLVGATNHPNLVLKRGFIAPQSGFVMGSRFFEMLEKDAAERGTGTITQLGPDLKARWRWEFRDGWICKWEGPDLDASKSELAFESIEIAHHGFKMIPASGGGTGTV